MSYLLDAIKQANTAPGAIGPEAYQQQSELLFYKRVVLVILLVLGSAVLLGAGYLVGKWIQNIEAERVHAEVVKQKDEALAASQAQQAKMTEALIEAQKVLDAHQKLLSQNQQPVTTAPAQVANVPKPKAQNNEVDLSQYRVLGAPLKSQEAPKNEDLAGIPDELKEAFSNAVAMTENAKPTADVYRSSSQGAYAEPLTLLPVRFQRQIPAFEYQAHIYASEPNKRWIKLNGQELYEGERLGQMQVVEILPDMTLMKLADMQFSVKALEDWM